MRGRFIAASLAASAVLALCAACERTLGYGVLLWASEDPAIPSGTVLPVYIKSSINQVWVAGIPDEYRAGRGGIDKFEVPIARLTLAGSRGKAQALAAGLAPYTRTYAETLQDGLPVRESPDNGARRVYRLRQGEVIKVLAAAANGAAAVGASGDPLPGEWLRVLTGDGVTGYCFSYRLRLFEHDAGALAAPPVEERVEDTQLEKVLARTWSPESYWDMLNAGQVDVDELSFHYVFDPGQDVGMARILLKDLDMVFTYTGIKATGTRAWRFEGSSLQMSLRSDTTLAVQYTENGGALKTLLFVALPTDVDDLILQETARREERFAAVYAQGPAFTSHNYGRLVFAEDGSFVWNGYDLLVPQYVPASALGRGRVEMRLFLAASLRDRYDGAFTLLFDGVGGAASEADFLYVLESQGLRLELVPRGSLAGRVVQRRAASPLVLYFSRAGIPAGAPGDWAAPAPDFSPDLDDAPGDTPVPAPGPGLSPEPVPGDTPALAPGPGLSPEPVPGVAPVPAAPEDDAEAPPDVPAFPEALEPADGIAPPAEDA